LVFFLSLQLLLLNMVVIKFFFLIILPVDGMNLCLEHDSYDVFYMIAM
jgi:hypothetical protein